MYKYILFTFTCLLFQASYSQDKEFPKLEKLVAEGKYEKCLKKADKEIRNKKNAREPLPYYYKSICLLKLDAVSAENKEYKRAAEQALKAALTFKRKDTKKQVFTAKLQQLAEEIRPVVLEKAAKYSAEGNCFKAVRVYDDLIALSNDITAMALKGECLMKSKESAVQGQNSIKTAIARLLKDPSLATQNPQLAGFMAKQAATYYDEFNEDSCWLLFARAVEMFPEDKNLRKTYTGFMIKNTSFIKNWYTSAQLEEIIARADHALKYYKNDPSLLEFKKLLYLSLIDNYILENNRAKAEQVYKLIPSAGKKADVSFSVLDLMTTFITADKPVQKETAFHIFLYVNDPPATSLKPVADVVDHYVDTLVKLKRYREIQELITQAGRLSLGPQEKEEVKKIRGKFEKALMEEGGRMDTSMATVGRLEQFSELAGGSAALREMSYKRALALLSRQLDKKDFSAFSVTYRHVAAANPAKPELKQLKKRFVLEDYKTNYVGTQVPDSLLRWKGTKANCYAGSVTDTVQRLLLARLSYFRRQAGVCDSIILDSMINVNCQAAAMMMYVNNDLSHNPPKNWKCYSQAAFDGASTANLSLGYHSTAALTGQFEDEGTQNYSVGHRRWILNPYRTVFGHGSTPNSMALGVFGRMTRASTRLKKDVPDLKEDEYISWPPPDYVMLPVVFRRWSFSLDGADFSHSKVIVSSDKKNISLVTEPLSTNSYGLNTIVWYFAHTTIQPGKTYQVMIKNVKLKSGRTADFSYEVNILKQE